MGRYEVVGCAWVEGALYIRSVLRWTDADERPLVLRADADIAEEVRRTARLLVRSRSGSEQWPVPTTSTVRLVPVEGSEAHVTLEVHAESRLDPRRLADGRRLSNGVWDVMATSTVRGEPDVGPVHFDLRARSAVTGGRVAVAYRNERGGLTVDTSARLRFLVNDSRPRLHAAALRATSGRLREVRVKVPLDGVRTSGPAVLHGIAFTTPYPATRAHRALTSLRRRLSRVAITPRPARITVFDDDVTLSFTAAVIPGTWRLEFEFQGTRKASRLLLKVPWVGSPRITELAERAAPDSEPVVSVVVPVHNGGQYLEPAIRSALEQSLPEDEVEVIAVDDGSTDGSLATLLGLASEHPNLRVIAQEASGAASRPRNVALDAARGRYVFFLDADDRLTPHALEKMTEVADATGSDVVLGKVLAVNHSNPERSAYRETVLDADVVSQRLFGTLTAHKLFRRSHVEKQGLRFPEDIHIGEDVLFVAEAELTASRIAVLADGYYYEWFIHDTGHDHLSQTGQSSDDVLEKASRLAEIVAMYVEDGPRRDYLMERSASYVLGVARRCWGRHSPDEAEELRARARKAFAHYWTPGLRDRLAGPRALVLDTFLGSDADAFTDLIAALEGNERNLRAVLEGSRLVYDVPPSVRAAIPVERLTPSSVDVRHQLTRLRIDGGTATVSGWIGTDLLPEPDSAEAKLRLRDSEEVIDVATRTLGPYIEQPLRAVRFSMEIVPASLPRAGIWDLVVAPRWDTLTLDAIRFGSRRTVSTDTDGTPVGSPTDILYFTATHGNLSISHDDVRRAPEVPVERLQFDEDGRPEVMLTLPAPDRDFRAYADVEPSGSREARHHLPLRRLDDLRVAARLPVASGPECLHCTLTVVHHGIRSAPLVPETLAPVENGALVVTSAGGGVIAVDRREVLS